MYEIKKINKSICGTDDSVWDVANTANIKNTWPGFDYVPKTTAKLLYNDFGIYLRLETDESPLLARFRNQNDDVCRDSCMEFFCRPNENDPRYLVFEFNPFGTMHFAIRKSLTEAETPAQDKHFFNVTTLVDDKKWVLSFCIPFAFIDEKFGSHTKTMYGNLYKCGDDLPQRHYVTYYPVKTEAPAFHKPEFFGKFILRESR